MKLINVNIFTVKVFFNRVHFHKKTCVLSTSHVKRGIAIGLMALNASSNSSLFTNVTSQLPSCRRNCFNRIYRLKKYLKINLLEIINTPRFFFGSKNVRKMLTVLAKRTSGIHKAQTTWAQ